MSLSIPIGSSSSTVGNRQKLMQHSLTTAAGRSNSNIPYTSHPLSIKWLHKIDLSTLHLLPLPSVILHASPTGTMSTATNAHRRTFYAYNFGLNPAVSSPKASTPSPIPFW
jgi:hypothetical protein